MIGLLADVDQWLILLPHLNSLHTHVVSIHVKPFYVIGNFNAKMIKVGGRLCLIDQPKAFLQATFLQYPAHPTPVIVCHTHSPVVVASNYVFNCIYFIVYRRTRDLVY